MRVTFTVVSLLLIISSQELFASHVADPSDARLISYFAQNTTFDGIKPEKREHSGQLTESDEVHTLDQMTLLGQYGALSDTTPVNREGDMLELDDERKQQFEKIAEGKANDFGKYLERISNKEEVEADKLAAIASACQLFVSDSSKVEVSSVNRPEKEQYTVPVYLDRLRMLPYDKVALTWMRAQMVSKFRKGQDGRYYGMIAAQQLFRGYLDNKIVYQDVTEKNIEIVLAQYDVFDEGVKKKKWDVLLSNVGVKQTREK